MRRSLARALLATSCAWLTTACHLSWCDQARNATFTGRLGDSTVAVGFLPTVPGGTDFALDQFIESNHVDNHITAKVNFSSFADSVALVRLTSAADPERATIISFDKTKGTQSGSVFTLDVRTPDRAAFEKVWSVFINGNGLLEVQPHQGQAVRARLKVLQSHDLHDVCT